MQLSIKCQKIVKNAHYNFPQPNVMSSIVLFCPTNNPKPKDIHFTVKEDKEN